LYTTVKNRTEHGDAAGPDTISMRILMRIPRQKLVTRRDLTRLFSVKNGTGDSSLKPPVASSPYTAMVASFFGGNINPGLRSNNLECAGRLSYLPRHQP
jgi:hypothetical protein